MSRLWVQIVSWHALVVDGYRAGKTLCGRRPASDAEVVDTLPAGKSCESCLRAIAREADTGSPFPDTDPVPDGA